jgi:hypothetical protein
MLRRPCRDHLVNRQQDLAVAADGETLTAAIHSFSMESSSGGASAWREAAVELV